MASSRKNLALPSSLNPRLLKALSQRGIHAVRDGDTLRVRAQRDGITAEILLPESLPLEARAVEQLLAFARVPLDYDREPRCACATPDFHPGSSVPVGSIVVTDHDLVIPQAIGTDVNCGMRLHALDVPWEAFEAQRERWVDLLRQDLLHGQRDVPTTPSAMHALFQDGLGAFWDTLEKDRPGGLFERVRWAQLREETERLHASAHVRGNAEHAPPALLDPRRGILRDPSLATLGGGNHFCEVQRVVEVLDRHRAHEMGLKLGGLTVMLRSGSRDVGFYVGQRWMDRAKAAWPAGRAHPDSGIYALTGALAHDYLGAMHAAAHYADANRALLAEMVRSRVREVWGDRAMPLVCDVPHNVVLAESIGNVHRKGATPAHPGQPLIIPGSMGHDSYVLDGLGAQAWASSASHGAGRAMARTSMRWEHKHGTGDPLGLAGVTCITLREERRIEEAPGAYKPIGPVVDAQTAAGMVKPVVRLSPVLTFKA